MFSQIDVNMSLQSYGTAINEDFFNLMLQIQV